MWWPDIHPQFLYRSFVQKIIKQQTLYYIYMFHIISYQQAPAIIKHTVLCFTAKKQCS